MEAMHSISLGDINLLRFFFGCEANVASEFPFLVVFNLVNLAFFFYGFMYVKVGLFCFEKRMEYALPIVMESLS